MGEVMFILPSVHVSKKSQAGVVLIFTKVEVVKIIRKDSDQILFEETGG